ncbi:MAG: 6,7-dimethyl-8-ribityllumazine synthase [bacterium]|nr:6,7-dimethyl-8-ribityllumazine synthase [bacterium]
MKKLPSKNDLQEIIEMSLRPAWRVGIVYSSYYEEEIKTMVNGAIKILQKVGMSPENISQYPVPGSFEIPLIGGALAKKGSVDALIGLGIIVEGQTHHARLVAENTARGMMDVQTKYGIPFCNEVLYVDSIELACERLYKGEEAAISVLHSLAQLASMQS